MLIVVKQCQLRTLFKTTVFVKCLRNKWSFDKTVVRTTSSCPVQIKVHACLVGGPVKVWGRTHQISSVCRLLVDQPGSFQRNLGSVYALTWIGLCALSWHLEANLYNLQWLLRTICGTPNRRVRGLIFLDLSLQNSLLLLAVWSKSSKSESFHWNFILPKSPKSKCPRSSSSNYFRKISCFNVLINCA